MKNNQKNAATVDQRKPLIVVAATGAVLLGAYILLALFDSERTQLASFGGLFLGLYLILTGYCLIQFLIRYRRAALANAAERYLTTEIGDLFHYAVDIPYAVVDEKGVVKILSKAMQEILGLDSPIFNRELSLFCRVPIEDVIYYTKNGVKPFDEKISDDGVPRRTEHPMDTLLNGRHYELRCFEMLSRGTAYYFIIFDDTTELEQTKKQLRDEDPVVAYASFDSLQELAKNAKANDHRMAANEIESRLKNWVAKMNGTICECEHDKYLIVFNRHALDECLAGRFPILKEIREIQLWGPGFTATISIGIGAVRGSIQDKTIAARSALSIAQQKGGDQVAVNDGESIKIYGGRVNTAGGSTMTTTSRVNSEYFCKLAKEAGNLLIMGHRNPDYDSIGSCVGLARLAICARSGDASKVRIVIDRDHENFRSCFDLLGSAPDYKQLFISGETAKDAVRDDTLLVMTDVSNPPNTESPKLFDSIKNVVIVDHHRRPDDTYSKAPLMTYICPEVSSAGELVSEMIQLSPYSGSLTEKEATLLLAGIMLDTKNFTVNVTSRTFFAAEYLAGKNVDMNAIKGLFTDEVEDLYAMCEIENRTRVYRKKVAITWLSLDRAATEVDRVNMSKVADRLMNLKGVEASFALLRGENTVSISARSRNKINVEFIMKNLGGGGHYDSAGASMTGVSLAQACVELKRAIDAYLDHEYEDKDSEDK